MNKQELFLLFFLSVFSLKITSQSSQIGTPTLDFDGKILTISFDIINENQPDKFFVWVVIQNKAGQILKMNSLSGDLGDIKAGRNKTITWNPAADSVFLNEEVTVEVKAEKYVKSYNKGSAILRSVILPGLGQTKLSNGKPYWIMGVASYGALAGGLMTYSSYKKNYDKYLAEETDPAKRSDYLSQAEQNAKLSGAMFVTAAAIWTANLFWVALTPNRYEPLKFKPITLVPSADPVSGAAFLTFRYQF